MTGNYSAQKVEFQPLSPQFRASASSAFQPVMNLGIGFALVGQDRAV
ncbi:hypothetical protein ACF1GY_36465 [Streptomyces sp. NPDC014684]